MKKYKDSQSADCIYMETIHNLQIRSNIRMIQNKQINPPQTPKPMSQNQSRRIVQTTKESQQSILQLQDNKILMSQLCQPMVIHSHRIASNNKQLTLENKRQKRSLNLDTHLNMIKQQHFLKKGGQVRQSQKETKPWYPFERMKRKQKLLTTILGQKQNHNTQNHQILTHFQSMADLTGWQINEDPQIEIQ
ncbi:unnamed protein product [Paramecium octaurelia]|uniref:Uncharacterized protein n=1 Tax=Paramecium octaurelia TaxID=43137 RepID=A0A8S1VY97_PAROT|nr:unnamed protein product [Paramecium octaurelia]